MSLPAYLRSNPDPLAGLDGDEPAPPPQPRAHRPERPQPLVRPHRTEYARTMLRVMATWKY